ncbi:MAG: Na(+)-translocating NADH-quinone reductase subunit A, partial [Fibrobacteria bacterium]|nr:Na(+)-translocating NADH-quinone reductase subunit A [Fibrobacteria bacterium]
MAIHRIKNGRNLNVDGRPSSQVADAAKADRVALCPPDFEGQKFKLEVKEGDDVKVGSKLMSSRANPDILFTSPAGGKVIQVNRGAQRRLLEIVIEPTEQEAYEEFKSFSTSEIELAEKTEIIKQLLVAGLWPYLIQRPFSRIADPTVSPKSIFVTAMDTEPNCADKNMLLEGQEEALQAGINALRRLTDGNVYLCSAADAEKVAAAISGATGVESHQFSGSHPTGNVGTHIHVLDPINKGDIIWHLNAEHAAVIGRFLLDGKVPVERLVALAGSSAIGRKYFKTRLGASISSVVGTNVEKGEVRYINGGVLTGKKVESSSYLGFYNSTVTCIPEGGQKEVFGWVKPGFKKPSFSRMCASALLPLKKWVMDTKVNGERRAIVASHIYDPLVTLDLHTNFLVKACIAGDIEEMEALGILECAPEDFALCTYA